MKVLVAVKGCEGAVDVEWMASELMRGLGTQPESAATYWTPGCVVSWGPAPGRVAVTSPNWQIDVSREGEGFAVAYNGDFDLCAARVCALVKRLDRLFVNLSPDERRLLWAVRQRLAS